MLFDFHSPFIRLYVPSSELVLYPRSLHFEALVLNIPAEQRFANMLVHKCSLISMAVGIFVVFACPCFMIDAPLNHFCPKAIDSIRMQNSAMAQIRKYQPDGPTATANPVH